MQTPTPYRREGGPPAPADAAPEALLGIDPGAGAIKVYGPGGGIQLPSIVAIDGSRTLSRTLAPALSHEPGEFPGPRPAGRSGVNAGMAGLARAKPPLRIASPAGAFWVGERAADWGRVVENLDHDRFTGSPELQALTYGGLTRYFRQRGQPATVLNVTIGLPLESLTGPETETAGLAAGVRRWLVGNHIWAADDATCEVAIAEVRIASQPAGALFDFLLDAMGGFIPARKLLFAKEIGVVSIGMSTVELLVARNGAPVNRFTAGQTFGVRRLLELTAPDGLYTLGELDALLRAGRLDISLALPIWASEVTGLIERRWGRDYRRFAAIVVVGGGALLLREALLARFGGKMFLPEDPVLATGRGLYKMALMQLARKRVKPARNSAEEAVDG